MPNQPVSVESPVNQDAAVDTQSEREWPSSCNLVLSLSPFVLDLVARLSVCESFLMGMRQCPISLPHSEVPANQLVSSEMLTFLCAALLSTKMMPNPNFES